MGIEKLDNKICYYEHSDDKKLFSRWAITPDEVNAYCYNSMNAFCKFQNNSIN